MNFRCETYTARYENSLQDYFAIARNDAPNNANAKRLRMDQYDGIHGDLFLILDESDKIWAMSSVILSDEVGGPVVKIYGRFHILPGCPHTLIDSQIEPASFKWIEDRQVKNVYLTINEEHLRTLEWVARRCGSGRGLSRKNPFGHTWGQKIRAGWRALPQLLLERNVWQYCIYYSEDARFFLDRPLKTMNRNGRDILQKHIPFGENCLGGLTDLISAGPP